MPNLDYVEWCDTRDIDNRFIDYFVFDTKNILWKF